MNGPALIAVAHGSGHPAAAEAVIALAHQVTRLAPVLDVRVAYLQHGEPSLTDALADAGPDPVVVPLLLSTGYHLTSDIAAAAGCSLPCATAISAGPFMRSALGAGRRRRSPRPRAA